MQLVSDLRYTLNMDLKGLGLNSNVHDGMELASFSSLLSSSYLTKFSFQKQQFHGNPHVNPAQTANQLMHTVDVLNVVPDFSSQHTQQLSDFSKTMKQVNVRKLDPYSNFSSMNISYLVGGFVGSKSQVGFTSMQGDRFQIWDLVWKKLIEIMGSDNQPDVDKTSEQHELTTEISSTSSADGIIPSEKVKQTYADVAKVKMYTSSLDSGKNVKPINKLDNNYLKSHQKQRRKHNNMPGSLCKGKSDFVRNEKKFSLHEANSFNSSRWSNSRKKHSKKGVEKLNQREKREAARDGIDFVHQESEIIDTAPGISGNGCLMGKIMKNFNLNKTSKKSRTVSNSDCSSKKENLISLKLPKETLSQNSICRTKWVKEETTDSENDRKLSRMNSELSGDSEDSFIVFNYDDTGSVESSLEFETDQEENSNSACNHAGFQSHKMTKCGNSITYDIPNVIKGPRSRKPMKGTCCSDHDNIPYISRNSICQQLRNTKDWFFNDYMNNFRRNSECSVDSEDSFIIFDKADSDDSRTCSSDSDDDDDSDVFDVSFSIHEKCYDAEDSDDQIGSLICSSYADYYNDRKPSYLNEINDKWKNYDCSSVDETRLKNNHKEVHFPPDNRLAKVKTMVTWDFASRAARVGPWEELARDTMRFHNRIKCIGEILQPILDPQHRLKVWKEHFNSEQLHNE